MGLADSVSDAPDAVLDAWLAEIDQAPAGTLETAKKLVWSEARCTALRQGLAAETNAFVARIGLPEVATGMARFLGERV